MGKPPCFTHHSRSLSLCIALIVAATALEGSDDEVVPETESIQMAVGGVNPDKSLCKGRSEGAQCCYGGMSHTQPPQCTQWGTCNEHGCAAVTTAGTTSAQSARTWKKSATARKVAIAGEKDSAIVTICDKCLTPTVRATLKTTKNPQILAHCATDCTKDEGLAVCREVLGTE